MQNNNYFLLLLSLLAIFPFPPQVKSAVVKTTTPPIRTPMSFELIFKARCKEYQEIVMPEEFANNAKNCTKLWTLFSQAFAYKDECSVEPKDYLPFINEADHYVNTTDRLLLWNGNVYPFVVQYARYSKKYITIRDQLAIYILKNIDNWCGQASAPGINYDRCRPWGSCDNMPVSSFWKQMSKQFVKKAKGTVYVMFNASSKVVFNPDSIFAKSELASLDPDETPILHAILVSNIKGPVTEDCKKGSMRLLRKEVEKKGMRFRCWDNDKNVRYFQCIADRDPKACSHCSATRSGYLFIGAISTLTSLLVFHRV